jgi:(p)ppGpp synthase/HD superfamily hydrolase
MGGSRLRKYVEVPFGFSLRRCYKGHQTSITTVEAGYLEIARHVVVYHHDGEYRKSGGRYENHPLAVAEIIRQLGLPVLEQVKALLHDILERLLELGDQGLFNKTVKEIEARFPKEVIRDVQYLTKYDRERYLDQLFQGNLVNPCLMLVKMADRLHNIKTIRGFSLEKRREYLRETLGEFMELCQRARESVACDHPSLLPHYDGLIAQLGHDAGRRLAYVEKRLGAA